MSGVVVIGAGMAASRFAEQLRALDPEVAITLVGEETHPPYNRILLSAVLEGTHRPESLWLREPGWYAEHDIDLRLGVRVLDIDRTTRELMLSDGTHLTYDHLVLATGMVPTLPPIRGIVHVDGRLDDRVHPFRSLTDCHGLLRAVPTARRAVVVGGGLLGLQVARALAIRGLEVEIVEGGSHLLRSQVEEPAGRIIARQLRRLGTQVYCGARAVKLTDAGLRLDNGFTLDTDLVVLTSGGRPSTALARRVDIAVRRGVVVDEHLTSPDDPRVHAIGDCAEYAGRTTGFVAPAWEQAGVLAEHLAGDPTSTAGRYDGSRIVARLRATDLDVAVLGDPINAEGERVEVANPITGTHRTLVVRDGVIVAAALVGDLSRIGLITQYYDRATVLGPHEPGRLLMGESSRADSPSVLPDDAEVCACAGVSAGRIRACSSLAQVVADTRATTGCGGCASVVRNLLATRTLEGTRP